MMTAEEKYQVYVAGKSDMYVAMGWKAIPKGETRQNSDFILLEPELTLEAARARITPRPDVIAWAIDVHRAGAKGILKQIEIYNGALEPIDEPTLTTMLFGNPLRCPTCVSQVQTQWVKGGIFYYCTKCDWNQTLPHFLPEM